MSIKIFEWFYQKNLSPNYTYFAILANKLAVPNNRSKLFELKKKMLATTSRRSNLSMIPTKSIDFFQPLPNIQFKTRTFLNKNFQNEEECEEIIFEDQDLCPDCHKLISLDTLSNDFEKMKKDLIWAQCPHCQKFINFKLGINVRYEGSNYENNYEKIGLHSPFYLKQILNEVMFKEFKFYLNLDKKCPPPT